MAFSIDRASSTPVFEQICIAIRAQAFSGELAKGMRLPPTRVLATELGVSRSTIVTAYEQLVAEGYLQSARGSGFTLRPMGEVELKTPVPSTKKVCPKKRLRPFSHFRRGNDSQSTV